MLPQDGRKLGVSLPQHGCDGVSRKQHPLAVPVGAECISMQMDTPDCRKDNGPQPWTWHYSCPGGLEDEAFSRGRQNGREWPVSPDFRSACWSRRLAREMTPVSRGRLEDWIAAQGKARRRRLPGSEAPSAAAGVEDRVPPLAAPVVGEVGGGGGTGGGGGKPVRYASGGKGAHTRVIRNRAKKVASDSI